MADYISKFTGAQIDEGVTKARTIDQELGAKQDVITDLDTIRANALAGSKKQDVISDLATIRSKALSVDEKQDVINDLATIRANASNISSKQDIIPDLDTIRANANAIGNKKDKATAVTHTSDTAVGSTTKPVYIDADGKAVVITSYEGVSDCANKDANGRNIANTYATKTEVNAKQDKDIAVTHTANTAAGSATLPVYVHASGASTPITSYEGNAATATKATQDASGNVITSTYATKTEVNAKQDTLVSGSNIKTINNEPLLGEGNIVISGGSSTLLTPTYLDYITDDSMQVRADDFQWKSDATILNHLLSDIASASIYETLDVESSRAGLTASSTYSKVVESTGSRNKTLQYLSGSTPYMPPTLTSNGVMGGDEFAVSFSKYPMNFISSGDAYYMFDGDLNTCLYIYGNDSEITGSCTITMYTPVSTVLKSFTVLLDRSKSGTESGYIGAVTVSGSTNNNDWATIAYFSARYGQLVSVYSISENEVPFQYYKLVFTVLGVDHSDGLSIKTLNTEFYNVGVTNNWYDPSDLYTPVDLAADDYKITLTGTPELEDTLNLTYTADYAKQTDTSGTTPVEYMVMADGHKICEASQEAALQANYSANGKAWYYLMNSDNTQFKLPRAKNNILPYLFFHK